MRTHVLFTGWIIVQLAGFGKNEIQDTIRPGIVARPSGPYGRTFLAVEPLPRDLASILDILSAHDYVTKVVVSIDSLTSSEWRRFFEALMALKKGTQAR